MKLIELNITYSTDMFRTQFGFCLTQVQNNLKLNHSKEHVLHLKQHCSLMNKCVLDKFATDVLNVHHHHFNVFSTFKCSFLLCRHWILILYSLWELSTQESFPVWKHESAEFLTYAENFLSFFFFQKELPRIRQSLTQKKKCNNILKEQTLLNNLIFHYLKGQGVLLFILQFILHQALVLDL